MLRAIILLKIKNDVFERSTYKSIMFYCDCFLRMKRNIIKDCASFWEDKVSGKCLAVAAVLKSWEHVKPPSALPATQSVATSKRNCTLVIRNILRMFSFLINFLIFLKKHLGLMSISLSIDFFHFIFVESFSFLLDNSVFVG